jgi:hypothetical protein
MLLSIRSHFRRCANFLIDGWYDDLYAKIGDSSESVPHDGWGLAWGNRSGEGTDPRLRITLRVK